MYGRDAQERDAQGRVRIEPFPRRARLIGVILSHDRAKTPLQASGILYNSVGVHGRAE